MSRFDEEPDADPHGECAAEIHRLQAQVEALTAQLDSYAMALNETKAERDKLATAVSIAAVIQQERDSYKKDAERLDWLNSQGVAYGFQQTHEGNKWEIEGPFRNLRVAIDDCRASIDREIAK